MSIVPGLCRAVDGLAGGEVGDRTDDEDVRPEAAGQDIGAGPAGDDVVAAKSINQILL